MKRTGAFLIFLGCLLLIYLGYGKAEQQSEMQELIKEIEQLAISDPVSNKAKTVKASSNKSNQWILTIPEIALELPVLEGTTPEILDKAAGRLESSGQLARTGQNFVIAAHRSHQFGQFFNRLDELMIGDEINITEGEKTYRYIINEKKVILPDQIEYLSPQKNKSMLTLVTCHPRYSDKKRLLVFSELAEKRD
ncbi:class D sortase [Bacillus infantis]|uniref:Class D sortase n=1 Tax=Bacillus infantis TaxID=324767 RepID=A0A5D4RNK5_9BACI|nr:class D sortase [Bacillus infantis]TYS51941.1 class D sortase [Bacillus infantis]